MEVQELSLLRERYAIEFINAPFFFNDLTDSIDRYFASCIYGMSFRVVTKISSCRINTTSRRGIKRLGISFDSIFLLFSNKSSRGPLS